MKPRNALWGFVRRGECWVPTWRGWLVLALLGIALAVTAASRVHPYLAVTEPIAAKVLVVEGWAGDYVLAQAKAEFERHRYARLYVTGGPLETGSHLSQYRTYAELGAATLLRMGMSKEVVVPVPAPRVRQDRTYTSALALKTALLQRPADGTSINLVSAGVHARRSWLLFQRAFGEGSRVGIIAVEDRDYDPARWWMSSQGVRSVVDEVVAYIYAVAIFPFV